MANAGDETLEMAALGRPFQLGMLYDCRKDSLIPGITLWNPEELKGSINKENQPITEFSVTASDSIEEKASALKVDASLKASLLVGLVKVGGAAKYFKDTKKSTRQSRVTLQYYTTTRFENLTMNHLAKGKVSHPSVFEDKTATHVVTAVLYGAQAYFVFDRQVSSEEKQQEIHGKMELAINKIPTFTVEGQGSIDLKETEKAEVEKFECTFHGDFHLKSNPSTYQDAVKAYSTLPELLGDKGENAVPVKVWLYPLIKLDSRAAKLERNISDYLVTSAQTVLEQFNTIVMQSNDMIKDIVTRTFPEVNEKIQQLKQSDKQYKLNFMSKLSAVLPSIRGGVQEEESLGEILNNHEESPFNFKAQHDWLNSKEREINALRRCLTILKDIHAVSSVNELDEEELNTETENIICFTFTSLHEPEPYLEDLKNYLETQASKKTQSSTPSKYLHQENKQWVSSETNLNIRMYLKVFQELVNINRENKKTKFFIVSKEDQEIPGACILLHENGSSKYIHFNIPSKPDVPEVCDVTHDSVTLKVVPPSSDADQKLKYHLEYKCINQKEWAIQSSIDKTETLTVSGLQPNKEYEFRYTVEGKLGYSVSSDTTSKVKTTSPPAQATVSGGNAGPELRMVLLGKNGVGKSASGNTILGSKQFISKLHSCSVTKVCVKIRGEVDGRSVVVVDTPGLFDTELRNTDTLREIEKCISMSSPGPHAFLIVILAGRFTKEEGETVDLIMKTFGEGAARYSIVLFTRGDDLEDETIEKRIQSVGQRLQQVVKKCGNRYHVFNNKEMSDRTQVTELLEKIQAMVVENGGYTNEMFKQAEKERNKLFNYK